MNVVLLDSRVLILSNKRALSLLNSRALILSNEHRCDSSNAISLLSRVLDFAIFSAYLLPDVFATKMSPWKFSISGLRRAELKQDLKLGKCLSMLVRK
jgi:hypothetical protein